MSKTQRVCFFNNCHNLNHVQIYGGRAFFDLRNSGRHATWARDLAPGQLCVVGSYEDSGHVIFRWYSFSNEAALKKKYGGERMRVFFGRFLALETLAKLEAARSVRYAALFKRTGDFKQGSVFPRDLRVADLPASVGQREMDGTPAADQRAIGAGFGDPAENRCVEAAAIRTVVALYKRDGWTVESLERDRCGFDLRCSKDSTVENVEVKGVRGSEPVFIITAGEVQQARTNPRFVLRLVTLALSSRPTTGRYTGAEFIQRFRLSPLQYRAALSS